MKIYISDIDGTVADCSHRLHYITNNSHDWDSFFENVHKDTPIKATIDVLGSLFWDGNEIIFVTGRPERLREETMNWLREHAPILNDGRDQITLYMRPDNDTRSDSVIKSEILNQILRDYNVGLDSIAAVFDDRPSVIDMWRKRGVHVFKIGDWEEEQKKAPPSKKVPTLILMVGPSGCGKSTIVRDIVDASDNRLVVMNMDTMRYQLTGDSGNQTSNNQVWYACLNATKAYLEAGFDVIVDNMNISRKDRMAFLNIAPQNCNIQYFVVEKRSLDQILETRNHRKEETVRRHYDRFQNSKKYALEGDNDPRVMVLHFTP